jgi:hypothetical protein
MFKIIKIITIASLFCVTLQALEYDKILIKAHAKLIPKIVLLDKSIKEKLVDDKIKIMIVSKSQDMESAKLLGKYIKELYKGTIANYPLELEYVDAKLIDMDAKASAVYLLSLPDENMQQIMQLIKKRGLMSFVYNLDGLSQGALISIRLESKTVIYFNKHAWQSDLINLRPGFFKVVKSYE